MNRRDFLKIPGALAAGAIAGRWFDTARARAAVDQKYYKEALWYHADPSGRVVCELCPNSCRVGPGLEGACRVRENRGGKFYTKVYGRPVTIHKDPIEKKPLFHFLPGTDALSVSNGGCNIVCKFCQNWQLSQSSLDKLPDRFGFVSADDLVSMAARRSCSSIAMTYAEPVVAHEYNLDVARVSKGRAVPMVMISNGFIETAPLEQLLDHLGAYKVDFKAFDDAFYKKICEGRLQPVLEAMKTIKRKGVWLEIVHLTIPGLNDDPDQTKRLCEWVLKNLGPDVPLHFTRFYPTYMMRNLPSTPPSTLERAWLIAKKAGVRYPYVGNLPGNKGENTHCHSCGALLIKRIGYSTEIVGLKDGKCSKCGTSIPGVWSWPPK